MASERDYYQVLGVPETATTDEIKKAFRRLAKQYHPDRNPNKPQAAERFKEINEAHDVLSDPEKRKKYDQLRRYGAFAGAGSGGGTRGPSGGGPGGAGVEFDLSDLGSFGGLGDLFSSIFGRRGGGPRAEDEDEIEPAVPIPFRVPGSRSRPARKTARGCGSRGRGPRDGATSWSPSRSSPTAFSDGMGSTSSASCRSIWRRRCSARRSKCGRSTASASCSRCRLAHRTVNASASRARASSGTDGGAISTSRSTSRFPST